MQNKILQDMQNRILQDMQNNIQDRYAKKL